MENLDKTLINHASSLGGYPETEEDTESKVVYELIVPMAAKVPAPHQHIEYAKLVVQQSSVTSTVPSTIITDLRVNNTAVALAWCVTATLVAPNTRRHSMIF
jgi:hypothetical protein